MSDGVVFTPMKPETIHQVLDLLSPGDLIAVTLADTNVLLGGVSKIWEYIWDSEGIFALSFNTDEGKRFGHSHIVHIPTNLIASISIVPLDDASKPKLSPDDPWVTHFPEVRMKLPVQDYPNPLASIISEHNMRVIDTLGLEIFGYGEKALSQDGIPSEGILFDNDFLMYTDWTFFVTQVGGNVSLSASPVPGIISIEKTLGQSPEQEVLQRLKKSVAEKIQRHISPAVGNYTILQGSLLVPNPAQDEIIEGEECHLYQIVESQNDPAIYPVLIKISRLKFPINFINRVSSQLTFYGELLRVPVNMLGENYNQVLLARAIAYIKD